MSNHMKLSLKQYVGQQAVKDNLKVLIDASIKRSRPLPHMLFGAPPGVGKTTLARAVQQETLDTIYIKDLSRFTRRDAFLDFFRYEFKGGILFLDEVHRASKVQQEDLLTLLEENYITGSAGQPLDVGWLTVIAATTEKEKLGAALRSRFAFKPQWEKYTDEQVADIVRMNNTSIPEADVKRLARAAAGVPRMARTLAQNWAQLEDSGVPPTFERVLELSEVDEDGVTHEEKKYLDLLHTLGKGGERNMSSMLRMSQSILWEIEQSLGPTGKGLITFGNGGRRLTDKGMARYPSKSKNQRVQP